jgi:hypothetical protein
VKKENIGLKAFPGYLKNREKYNSCLKAILGHIKMKERSLLISSKMGKSV